MQTVTLTITGMHCEGCAEIVRHVIDKYSGVKGCTVSHTDGEARIALDNSQTSGEQLARAIREAGYSADVASA